MAENYTKPHRKELAQLSYLRRRVWLCLLVVLLSFSSFWPDTAASAQKQTDPNLYSERLALYKKMEVLTSVPWPYLAAVDSYERGLRKALRDREQAKGLVSIYYPKEEWVGALNPNINDNDPTTISLFEGIGLDGNGDGKANIEDDEDVLYTFARYLESHGYSDEDFRIALWHFYQREQSVNIVSGHAKVYETFQTLDLHQHAFVMPLHHHYSYRSTWGAKRGWGGRRIHEGTDIFANYNVPIQSSSYGIVETIGWNPYGGWRVGIRDLDNIYHYYAHLNGYEKGLEKGSIVKAGQVIGYCGSSGYGKPGTQGKFPPHLHYGMYRDNGISEWSFDPFPSLKQWERADKNAKKNNS
ncbi:peptidase M23 [Shouchella clausii]|nr:peptidase M23 [Shouchella clausii]NMM68575.1 peptidoglycan DD-metalloendopeptidase family protein [Shouchella clausii]NPC13489.1 M23 family metallopeptidase [Shouchella clausii]PAD18825.1 peptidase M23 [Shouchella clausii]PAE82772.1 peptidase M23 [Shouchella clausii]